VRIASDTLSSVFSLAGMVSVRYSLSRRSPSGLLSRPLVLFSDFLSLVVLFSYKPPFTPPPPPVLTRQPNAACRPFFFFLSIRHEDPISAYGASSYEFALRPSLVAFFFSGRFPPSHQPLNSLVCAPRHVATPMFVGLILPRYFRFLLRTNLPLDSSYRWLSAFLLDFFDRGRAPSPFRFLSS